MKIFLLTFFILLTQKLDASEGDILRCLGREEKEFHLNKKSGPIYDLNQRLISELIQIPRVMISQDDLETICKGPGDESLKLLEISLKKGRRLFISPTDLQGMEKAIQEQMIDDFVNSTKEIFLTFIAQIQSLSPSPTCLEEEIPELKNFFVQVKYLQEDVETKQLFKDKDLEILKKIKFYPQIFDKCRERIKRNPKSSST